MNWVELRVLVVGNPGGADAEPPYDIVLTNDPAHGFTDAIVIPMGDSERLQELLDHWAPRTARMQRYANLVEAPQNPFPIQVEALADLAVLGEEEDGDVVSEIVQIFLQDVPAYRQGLRDSVNSKRHAHTLKSASRSVGAIRLSELCAGYEQDQVALNALLEELDAVENALMVLQRARQVRHSDSP